MAASVREQIIQRIVELIDTAVNTATVYRSRDAALATDQLPAVIVTPLSDNPAEERGSICWRNHELTIAVDVLVGSGVDAAADPILSAVHAALLADRTLAPVPGVMNLTPGTTQWRMVNSGGEIAFVRAPFTIDYRCRHDDLTSAPS